MDLNEVLEEQQLAVGVLSPCTFSAEQKKQILAYFEGLVRNEFTGNLRHLPART